MPMVNVREVRMRMHKFPVLVPMRMRLPWRVIRAVRVSMVLIVNVRMLVL